MEPNLIGQSNCASLDPQMCQFPGKDSPFPVYVFPEFLKEAQQVDRLRQDVTTCIDLHKKDNDLYKFKQSLDIKSEVDKEKISATIRDFIKLMLGPTKEHLEKIIDNPLSGKNFDITISLYNEGDYLLCHNDDIKDRLGQHARSLAFVYYLNNRPWAQEDGGALALFKCESTGEPVEVSQRIWPRPNTLVVFPTMDISWHSVEEVLCKNDSRLSINGWFHSDTIKQQVEPQREIEPCPYAFYKPISLDERTEKFFQECINQNYLMERTCYSIKRKFKRNSEINLTDFLVKEKYLEICQALKEATSNEANLVHVGSLNKRNYKTLKVERLPAICKDLYDAFRSELFFMLISRFTGLELRPPSLRDNGKQTNQAREEEAGTSSEIKDDESDEDMDSSSSNEDEDDDDYDSNEGQTDSKVIDEENGVSNSNNSSELLKAEISQSNSSSAANEPKKSNANDNVPTDLQDVNDKRQRISNPIARLEFRHIDHGTYTIVHDYAYELGESSALDVMLHFNHDFEVNLADGGYISYIDSTVNKNDQLDESDEDDGELLTIEPNSNCLSLIYRDSSTSRFLKYINKSHIGNYQDLSCVFYEDLHDLPRNGKDAVVN